MGIKAAIVGCGMMGDLHANAILKNGGELVCAVGSDVKSAAAFADRWKVVRYTDTLGQALESGAECFHLCTPANVHSRMIRSALLHGKHVISEKPLCVSPQEAKELYEIASEQQLVHAVGFNVRYHSACMEMRKQAQSGQLGSLQMIHGAYLQEFHMLPAPYSWRYRPELAGSMRAVTEIGSHWMDLARFLSGREVEAVSANFYQAAPERTLREGVMYPSSDGDADITVSSEDAAAITLRLSGNVFGSLLVSEISPGRVNRLSIELSGSEGSLSWCAEEPYTLLQGAKGKGVCARTAPFGGGYQDTLVSMVGEVYNKIEDRTCSVQFADFYDGFVNAAVCEAVYESATHGGRWTDVRLSDM